MLQIRVINKSKHPLPAYATELAAGLDLKANISDAIILKPLQRQLIETGLFINCLRVSKRKFAHVVAWLLKMV